MGFSEEPILIIAEAVSDALDVPIEELPPLSRSVDLDGLEAIMTDGQSQNVMIAFSYAGHRVHVHSNSAVYVHPVEDGHVDRPETTYFE
jgi:hypothetical protein